jgi:hypothetical protein
MQRPEVNPWLRAVAMALSLALTANAYAGDAWGDIANETLPGAMDGINEALLQTGASMLQQLILRSRDDALRAGVQPIPPEIRQRLTGFIPDNVLNTARFRIQGGADMTLQANAIRYGETQAITLDDVIVFKEANDALHNATLWAHELTHVNQYLHWGVRGFSVRYVQNYEAVEREAYDAETRYKKWAATTRAPR